jgi:tetratricopeptide (TPR) repeat protein
MMLDFSTELEPLTPAETYQVLTNALDMRSGFGLIFLQCSPAEADRLIPKICKDLPDKNIGVMQLEEPINNLFHLVAEREDRSSLNVLFIRGLEKSLESDIKPGSGGLGNYYNRNTVPPILSHLNQQRENFRDHFRNICFVFVLPKFGIQYFLRRAPDFFDWNSGLFEISNKSNQKILDHVALNVAPKPWYKRFFTGLFSIFSSQSSYDDLFNEAISCSILGRYEEVIAAYDQALAIKPDDYEALYNKGVALGNLNRYEEAIAVYNQALAIKPDDYEALNNKGIALSNLGRYEEAIAAYDQALTIKPDDDAALNNKGITLSDLGRYEEAIAVYNQALAIKPNDYTVLNNKGITLSDLGSRYEEAKTKLWGFWTDIKR